MSGGWDNYCLPLDWHGVKGWLGHLGEGVPEGVVWWDCQGKLHSQPESAWYNAAGPLPLSFPQSGGADPGAGWVPGVVGDWRIRWGGGVIENDVVTEITSVSQWSAVLTQQLQ